MVLRKCVTGGAAALAAASLPFVTDIPRAGANSFYQEEQAFQLEYVAPDGDDVLCSVSGRTSLIGPEGDFFARSENSVFTTEVEDCRASLLIEVSYVDTAGVRRTTSAQGTGTELVQDSFDVGSDYQATHTITLLDCRPSAGTVCSVSFSTRPK
jgi:hypothetical protein